ncbi:MAG: hypothetical protein QOD93_3754 [Acetobacteraceae bacterium]|jgi:hypothetical protein|nr:hypothetical protein [Acetobacteraceae bacterium]MEA2770792.1 hypothetical protein [Acetobacteraceae bacterium]
MKTTFPHMTAPIPVPPNHKVSIGVSRAFRA